MIVVVSFVLLTVLVGAVTYYFVRDDEYKTVDSFFLADGRSLSAKILGSKRGDDPRVHEKTL